MLPVDESLLTPIDMKVRPDDTPRDIAYKELLKDQLAFCQSNSELILKRANKLYDIVVNYPDKNINFVKRCCRFDKLEKVLQKYLNN